MIGLLCFMSGSRNFINGGGGAQKIVCSHAYITSAKQRPLNPIPTGLVESKFQLGGVGGGQFPPSDLGPKGPIAANFAWMSRHIDNRYGNFSTVYLIYYHNLCKLDAY